MQCLLRLKRNVDRLISFLNGRYVRERRHVIPVLGQANIADFVRIVIWHLLLALMGDELLELVHSLRLDFDNELGFTVDPIICI